MSYVNNPVYRGVRPLKPEEITEPTVNVKPVGEPAMIPGSPQTDSHQHRSGLIAQASSNAKESLHNGGFFKVEAEHFTPTKK